MPLKSNIFRALFLFIFVLSCSLVIFADTIRLKDGSVIKGKIVGFNNGQFQVQIGDGARARQMSFFADEVEAIEFDGSSDAAKTALNNGGSILPRPTSTPNTIARNPQPTPTPTPNNTASNSVPTNPNPVNIQPVNTANNSTPVNSPTTNSSTASPQTSPSRPKPIQLNIKVLADNTANGWTNAGWVVRKGQKIRITGNGRISLGGGNYSTPAGLSSLADKDKLMQSQPTGGLLAVVGDDNNDFIFVGNSKEFTATRDGALFLGINEGNLDDNSGSYEVIIEIDPGM